MLRVGVFANVVIAIDQSVPDRAGLSKEVLENDGLSVLNVNHRVNYVIVNSENDAFAKTAELFGIPSMKVSWLKDSIKTGGLKPASAAYSFKWYANGAPAASAAAHSSHAAAAPAAAASSSSAAAPKVDSKKRKAGDDDDDDENEAPASGAAKSTKVKVLKKGRAAVDPNCKTLVKTAHVYEEGSDIWDCMLNQTNIGANNNKFYVIQLLESDDKKKWYTWNRWGRVGATGQSKLQEFNSLEGAKKDFRSKFSSKSGNDWSDRANFKSRPGKYTLLEIDYGSDNGSGGGGGDNDEEDKKKKLAEKKKKLASMPDSKLEKPVQELIKLICNVQMMENQLVELEFDIQKMPLGKLKKNTIQKGYAVLKQIESVLKGTAKGSINELSSQFYTLIPHNFGMRAPPAINDFKTLSAKLAMLETLGDIEIAQNLLKQADDANLSENPIDGHYRALKTALTPLAHNSDTFKMLQKYVQQTHAPTHTNYKLEVLNIFEVARDGEAARASKYNAMPNHQLLWHGSRLTNWMGILSQGLRIAPPEAPVTGYMFGKGVYFADMSSKSANYCCTTPASNTGIMILSEVALGKTYDLKHALYMDKAPAGFDSTKGVGKTEPDPKETVTLPDGVKVPLGKPVPSGAHDSSLLYHEYIVYDVAQVQIRYLFQLKFHYK